MGSFLSRLSGIILSGLGKAYPVLSRIERTISNSVGAGAAASAAYECRPLVYRTLRRHFSHTEAQALTLKILNILLSRRHMRARDSTVFSRPIGLVVDPSNMCQLACPGCVHSDRSERLGLFNWPNGTLSLARFEALLAVYGAHAIGVYFCNYGEPLLNRGTPALIRLAKQYLMATGLSTSLSVRNFDAEAYVDSGLDTMLLSIDGATQPVYERFRRNGSLELVLDNLRRIVAVKRARGRGTPVLAWRFLAFEHNVHEAPMAESMARELGVDYFHAVTPFDISWDAPDCRPARMEPRFKRLSRPVVSHRARNWNPSPHEVQATAIAQAYDAPLGRHLQSEDPESPGSTCHWLYKNMVMDATGRIMPCCGAPSADGAHAFGQFDNAGGGVQDPFNSVHYEKARRHFAGGEIGSATPPFCAQCEWDHTRVNIGGEEIRQYFSAASWAVFDRWSLDLLSGW